MSRDYNDILNVTKLERDRLTLDCKHMQFLIFPVEDEIEAPTFDLLPGPK